MSRTFRYKRAVAFLPDRAEINEAIAEQERYPWAYEWLLKKISCNGKDPLSDRFDSCPWSSCKKKASKKHVRNDERKLIHKILTDPEMDHVATIGKKRVTDWDYD